MPKKKSLFRHLSEKQRAAREKRQQSKTKAVDELKTLKDEVRRLQKIVNPRIRRLKSLRSQNKALSRALLKIEESGGNIKIKGLNTKSELMREIMRAKNFLNDETSTVKGAEKFNRRFEGNDAWTILDRLKSFDVRLMVDKGFAYAVEEKIEQYLDENVMYLSDETKDTLTDMFKDRLDDIYEENIRDIEAFREWESKLFQW